MGLVDKVLELFKLWVSLEVEDFGDNGDNGDTKARLVFEWTTQQHAEAVVSKTQALESAPASPTSKS